MRCYQILRATGKHTDREEENQQGELIFSAFKYERVQVRGEQLKIEILLNLSLYKVLVASLSETRLFSSVISNVEISGRVKEVLKHFSL